MSWKTIRADEFCESVRDGTHDTPKPNETGYKLVTGKHVKNGQIDPSDAYYISEKDYKKINERSLVEQWDVLMSMIGTVGEVAVVKDHPNYAIKNVALFKCGGSELKGKWLAYYLRSSDAQGHMSGNQKGSSQQFLSLNQLRSLPIPITDERYMQRVIDILSAYDELIENNQKQIKLLEEAAQRLYKEWFVDLRFPGHETTPIVDGVPEGWKKDSLGGICTLKKDTVSAGKIPVGTPYIGLEHMPRVDFCLSSWGNAEEVTSNKFQYTEDDIIFGKIRPYFHKVGFALNSGVVSTDSFVLKANDGLWGLLLMTVFDKLFVDYTYQTCKEGAKMPRADWGQMEKYPVLIPPKSVRQDFEEFIWNNTRRVKVLALQNHALAEARDRLLPKLMSGEIKV